MRKIILIIFMAMISSFSYYGAVNENGEKVVDFTTSSQEENVIDNQITEEIQENIATKEIEVTKNVIVEENETKADNIKTTEKETSKSQNVASTNKVAENKTTTITNTIEKTNSTSTNTTSTTNQTTTQNEVNSQENETVKVERCTNCNNHAIEVGNSNKWYSSEQEAIAEYKAELKKWGNKWTNNEITKDTYYQKCPSGYETWSCFYCQKWTINYYYN